MRVGPHAAVDQVEVRELAFFQAEELADLRHVARGGGFGSDLSDDAVNQAVRHVRGLDQVLVGELVIAGRIGRRNTAFVHPKEVHAVPREFRSGQPVEEDPGSGAARDGEGGILLSGEDFIEDADYVMRAGFSGSSGIRRGIPADAHFSPGYASRAADARVRYFLLIF